MTQTVQLFPIEISYPKSHVQHSIFKPKRGSNEAGEALLFGSSQNHQASFCLSRQVPWVIAQLLQEPPAASAATAKTSYHFNKDRRTHEA